VIGYLEWKIINPQQLGSLMPGVLILTLCAFTDELIFRGLIQQSIEKAQGSSFIAIFLTSILYTTFFISFLFSLELLLIFLVAPNMKRLWPTSDASAVELRVRVAKLEKRVDRLSAVLRVFFALFRLLVAIHGFQP